MCRRWLRLETFWHAPADAVGTCFIHQGRWCRVRLIKFSVKQVKVAYDCLSSPRAACLHCWLRCWDACSCSRSQWHTGALTERRSGPKARLQLGHNLGFRSITSCYKNMCTVGHQGASGFDADARGAACNEHNLSGQSEYCTLFLKYSGGGWACVARACRSPSTYIKVVLVHTYKNYNRWTVQWRQSRPYWQLLCSYDARKHLCRWLGIPWGAAWAAA